MFIPAHDTNTGIMSMHASELCAFLNVPDLYFSRTEANADICSVARPLDTTDVGIWAGLQERADSTRLGGPDVDVSLETNCDLVARRPIKKVEVVVIDETRSVKHALWGSSYATSELS